MATVAAEPLGPQKGPQEQFHHTCADIAVYGGSAGSGKSFALELEPCRYLPNPNFHAVIFRRTYAQIRKAGSLWDISFEIYPRMKGTPREGSLDWTFPTGSTVAFAHMQHEQDRLDWDGSQIPYIGFDQLESFTAKQFFYMLGRNRSLCGVRPYVRATCNPDPDHFLRRFMAWWIDEETGYPIWERSGVIRYFLNINDEVHWAENADKLKEEFGDTVLPKSFTFIPGTVFDNKMLLEKDPGYLANLQALPKVDRERLLGDPQLGGNWNVRETAGSFFRKEWFEIVDACPELSREVRYWDRAGTDELNASLRSSATAGVRMGVTPGGKYVVRDTSRFQKNPPEVPPAIKNIATQDGVGVDIGLEQDPGQAGKSEVLSLSRYLAGFGFTTIINVVRESKGNRAKPYSAQAEQGNVALVRGPWNDSFIQEHENFDGSKGCMSDQVDGASGAYHILTNPEELKEAGVWGR